MNQLIYLALLLQFFTTVKGSAASCPVDYNYIHQIPWDSSSCQSGDNDGDCCQTLLSLFDVGLAQYLKDYSMFEFPDQASATACINEFQQKVSSTVPSGAVRFPAFVPGCRNTSEFVSSPNLCNGIQTKQNWTNLLGTTAIDSSCNVDLSDLTACSSCFNGAQQVTSRLVEMEKNATDISSRLCLRFSVLYLAAVSEFGPKNPNTASCAFKLPLALPKTKNKSRLVLISVFSVAAVIIVSLLGFLIINMLRSRRKRDAAHREFLNRNRELLREIVRPNTGAVWFNIEEIKAATDNFSRANLLGQGSFGTVYRGWLHDGGGPVAVKRIRNCSAEGDADFLNEMEIINNIRHRNLVALRGCCVASDYIAGHQRFLIYDYMPNGSLDEHLFGGMSKAPLSWPQRKNIILGTAKGLAYLHRGVQPAIYHRDIKPTNILLDDQMNACVSDFGLARIMSKEAESHLTTKVAGTYGYLAPEYALYGQLTDKSDVYSFGIVLLEIMSGRKALDTSLESASNYLISDWAWRLVKAGKAMEVIDEMLRDSDPVTVMVRFVSVGILCAHVMVTFRPTITDALKMLEGDIEIPEIPDRPLPMTHRSLSIKTAESETNLVDLC